MSLKTLVRLAPTVLILSGLAAMHPAAAQFITFGAAQTISKYTDVSKTGTLVDAYNFGSSGIGGPYINTVPFSAMTSLSGAGHLSISFPSTSTDIEYQYFGSTTSGTTFNALAPVYKNLLTDGLSSCSELS